MAKTKWLALTRYLGPAFIVSVAYVDPGNFATNISGGSLFGYNLVWVILWNNLVAIFCQTMSAKLGIATGHNLPRMCAGIFSRKTNWLLWVVAEVAAIHECCFIVSDFHWSGVTLFPKTTFTAA